MRHSITFAIDLLDHDSPEDAVQTVLRLFGASERTIECPLEFVVDEDMGDHVQRHVTVEPLPPPEDRLVIPLPNGRTLECGRGEEHEWGGFVRVSEPDGTELAYWDSAEWGFEPEQVMGAIFAAALGLQPPHPAPADQEGA